MAASLELAISAIRAGRKDEGRQLLNLLIQQDPNNEQAWLWMSSVVDTDEKRARCLYHVLAVNPGNELARKGLNILGIVLTDSRPVRVPTDSQPISIPVPSAQTSPSFPHELKPASHPVPALVDAPAPVDPAPERRPFRIDPETITRELPFTPVSQPFNGNGQQAEQPSPPEAPPSKSVVPATPVVETPSVQSSVTADVPLPDFPSPDILPQSAQPSPLPPPPQPNGQGVVYLQPNPPQQPDPPSQPVQPIHPNLPAQPPAAARPDSQPVYSQPQYPMGGHETRPTQPFPAAQPTMPPPTGLTFNQQHPSEPIYVGHSNVTMGMPSQYMQNQPQPQYYPQPYPPMALQNPTVHSNSTMAMPLGYAPMPAANTDYRALAASHKKPHPIQDDGDESESEVNILAVIIFGSLSVTALGGLGMLILLMFTAGA
jgi:hypothetical protein